MESYKLALLAHTTGRGRFIRRGQPMNQTVPSQIGVSRPTMKMEKSKTSTCMTATGSLMQHQVPYETTFLDHRNGTILWRDQRGKPVEDELDTYGNWTRQRTHMTIHKNG